MIKIFYITMRMLNFNHNLFLSALFFLSVYLTLKLQKLTLLSNSSLAATYALYPSSPILASD